MFKIHLITGLKTKHRAAQRPRWTGNVERQKDEHILLFGNKVYAWVDVYVMILFPPSNCMHIKLKCNSHHFQLAGGRLVSVSRKSVEKTDYTPNLT